MFRAALGPVLKDVEVCNAPGRGCYIVARRDLPDDYRLMACSPLAFSPNADEVKYICDTCFHHSETAADLLACKTCHYVSWCSPKCEALGRQYQHDQVECDAFAKIQKKNCSRDTKMWARQAIRLIVLGVKESKGSIEPKMEFSQNSSTILLFPPSSLESLTSCSDKEKAYTIYPNTSITPGGYKQFSLLVNNLSAFTPLMIDILETAAKVVVNALPRGICDSQLVVNLMASINCNQFGLYNNEESIVAKAVYTYLSGFNHSCSPNLYTDQELPDLALRTRRAVAAGEELTISYIGLEFTEITEVRKKLLKNDYHFECKCVRCSASE